MITDDELLAMAAKAAGIPAEALHDGIGDSGGVERSGWNPLTDDGDALRLAVKMGMRVYGYPGQGDDFTVAATDSAWDKQYSIREDHGADPYAATRRAIVRAAAEVGKAIS